MDEIDESPQQQAITILQQRRGSTASAPYMSEDDQRSRRNSIKNIMQDSSLSAAEKRRSIQSLMDGRRRSSTTGCSISSAGSGDSHGHVYVSNLAADARAAAIYFDSSDDEAMASDVESEIEIEDEAAGGGSSGAARAMRSPDSSLSFTSNQGFQLEYGEVGAAAGQASAASLLSGADDNATTISTMLDRKPPDKRRVARSHSLQHYGAGQYAAVAAASTAFLSKDPQAVNRRMEMSRPKCDHYERQCTLVSPCCGLAFGCRICHDECPVLPPPFNFLAKDICTPVNDNANDEMVALTDSLLNKKPKIKRRASLQIDLDEEETHHEIDRFAVREVICRKCYTRQSSKTNNCVSCGIQFGDYHCSICNLWMPNKESPYHCDECGFCRVGGRENFRHCDDCGMCIDALLFDDHNCKLGKYMSDCPVCQEDLFSSRYASHEMPCGHAIHWHCFKELTSYDTRCPVCKKTAETAEQMAPTWSAMAMGIALQPVPPELARVVTILCCDCEERDENRRWHFLGVRCTKCLSFNTTVERTVMTGREAAAFLDELEGVHGGEGGEGGGGGGVGAGGGAVGALDPAQANSLAMGGNLVGAMLMNAETMPGIPANFGMLLSSNNNQEEDSMSDATMEDEEEQPPGAQETSSGSSSSFQQR